MAKQPNFTITTPLKVFRDTFALAAAATPGRTTKDVLKNVKLEIPAKEAKEAPRLIATDSEVSLRVELGNDVSIDYSGKACAALLPPGRLGQILKELAADELVMQRDDEGLWIRSGLSEWKLQTEDPADFPPVAPFEADAFHTIAVPGLVKAIEQTVFATDQESTKYALGGVLVELSDAMATFAATDSRRLAVVEVPCNAINKPAKPAVQTVVPAKAMKLIQSVASGDEAKFAFTGNTVSVECGRFTVASQLVQGRFPDWRKVVPTKFEYELDVVAGPFLSAVRQSQIVTNEESRGVDFTFTDGTLRLSSKAADIGTSKIELPVSYTGSDLTVTFDPRYIADFLRVLDGSSGVSWQLVDHESAALLSNGDGYRYVIMPLSRDR